MENVGKSLSEKGSSERTGIFYVSVIDAQSVLVTQTLVTFQEGNSVVRDHLSPSFERGLACICFGDFVFFH